MSTADAGYGTRGFVEHESGIDPAYPIDEGDFGNAVVDTGDRGPRTLFDLDIDRPLSRPEILVRFN
jgi:hypothetical protein